MLGDDGPQPMLVAGILVVFYAQAEEIRNPTLKGRPIGMPPLPFNVRKRHFASKMYRHLPLEKFAPRGIQLAITQGPTMSSWPLWLEHAV